VHCQVPYVTQGSWGALVDYTWSLILSFPQRCRLAPHATTPWLIWGTRQPADHVPEDGGQLREARTSNRRRIVNVSDGQCRYTYLISRRASAACLEFVHRVLAWQTKSRVSN
jgi:hypothetical protein